VGGSVEIKLVEGMGVGALLTVVGIEVSWVLDVIGALDVGLTVGFNFVGGDDTTSKVGCFEVLGDLVFGFIEEGSKVGTTLDLTVDTPSVACTEGLRVGLSVGIRLGAVGILEGIIVGILEVGIKEEGLKEEGTRVGVKVGLIVGRNVGPLVEGRNDGLLVGLIMGAHDGLDIGESVATGVLVCPLASGLRVGR